VLHTSERFMTAFENRVSDGKRDGKAVRINFSIGGEAVSNCDGGAGPRQISATKLRNCNKLRRNQSQHFLKIIAPPRQYG
jgi:hypothetical protein